jgi:hypothetical protein
MGSIRPEGSIWKGKREVNVVAIFHVPPAEGTCRNGSVSTVKPFTVKTKAPDWAVLEI